MRTPVLLAVILGLPVQSGALVSPELVAVATRTSRPPKIDGNLGDPVWAQAVSFTDFTQQDPDEGEKPSQKTEVRILYDDHAIYFGIRCFDTDPETIVATSTRPDRDAYSDAIWLDLDTRGDGRSAWHFEVSAAGCWNFSKPTCLRSLSRLSKTPDSVTGIQDLVTGIELSCSRLGSALTAPGSAVSFRWP